MSNAHRDLADPAFTYDWYREFLERLRSAGYRFRSFDDDPDDGGVFLRHDVDLSPRRALEMARLEADAGVSATYLFLLSSPLYNPFEGEQRTNIREIASLGHDVGIHFSTHQYWAKDDPPTDAALRDRVAAERSAFDAVIDADAAPAVSFHIPPDWVLDRRFDGFRSAYEPALFSEIGYVADSGQRWREDPPRIAELPDALQVLTHPGLWGDEDASFERRIERAAVDAGSRAWELAHREFVDGVYS